MLRKVIQLYGITWPELVPIRQGHTAFTLEGAPQGRVVFIKDSIIRRTAEARTSPNFSNYSALDFPRAGVVQPFKPGHACSNRQARQSGYRKHQAYPGNKGKSRVI